MAIDRPLTAFFGLGATQDATTITILKADLVSNKTPPAFIGLIPQAVNTSESIFSALLMKIIEEQDTSQDSQLRIFPPESSIVTVVADGVPKPFDQYLFTLRMLIPRGQEYPNPNLI
ncbi:hypothetical protein QUA70_12365 [Microcoleus sp. LAD1_D5]|uniref:hypothetical protein n=1 Tax=unclassified Microcoleus TaxID=2642155 RepID=UPI002FCFC3C0